MRARPGEAIAKFHELLEHVTAECVDWPFSVSTAGYGQVGTEGTVRNVHAMACEHHHGQRPEGMQAAHSCHNRRCMNGLHLRWATPADNSADMVADGTRLRGSAVAISKLDEDAVHDIRGSIASAKDLAARYGVSTFTVYAIQRRTVWAWVPEREAVVTALPFPVSTERQDVAS